MTIQTLEQQILAEHIRALNIKGELDPLSEDIELWNKLGVHTPDELDAYIEPMP